MMERQDCHCISGIVCDATNCTYNDAKRCTATCIEVGGTSATKSCDTECNTFKAK